MEKSYIKQIVNLEKLHDQMAAAFADNFKYIILNGEDDLILHFERNITSQEESDCDNLVNNFVEKSLEELKDERYLEIDTKTHELILVGFVYDSERFSLSLYAQTNWTTIKSSKSYFSFPMDISTLNNDTYSLKEEDVDDFWGSGITALMSNLDAGRALKQSILLSIDESAVNTVRDSR